MRDNRDINILDHIVFYCLLFGGLKPPALAGSFSISSSFHKLPNEIL
jgi:hypothetical protein